MKLFRKLFYILIAAAPFVMVACGDDDNDDNLVDTSGNRNANYSDTMEGVTFSNTEVGTASLLYVDRLEMPHITGRNTIFVTHVTTDYKGEQVNYSVLYDRSHYHSRWVAYRFDTATSASHVGRKDYNIKPQYPEDPLCKGWSLPDDLGFAGYDHGHLCASAERYYSRQANDQTFYMTDMSPQIGDFNAGYWTTFEKFLYSTARNKTSAPEILYVVKGGTLNEGQTLGSFEKNGYRVTIPKYYFIACLAQTANTYRAIGFWVEHKLYGTKDANLRAHAVSIDELERLTGIDFFCNLPDAAEDAVEQSYDFSAWGL